MPKFAEQRWVRRGFTLIEMMVSLAVIAVALAVVVSAFTITAKTAQQASAYSAASAVARQFELRLEEDLRGIDPSESLLVLVGGVQAGADSAADLAARHYYRVLVGDPAVVPSGYDASRAQIINAEYSDPRTDILMFFTNVAMESRAPLPIYVNLNGANDARQRAIAEGARLSPQQVVYGHAAFGDIQVSAGGAPANGPQWSNNVRHIFTNPSDQLSPIPANQWDVVRRAVAIENVRQAGNSPLYQFDPGLNLNDVFRRLLRCTADTTTRRAGDVAQFDLTGFLSDPRLSPLFHPYGRSIAGSHAQALYSSSSVAAMVNGLLYPPNGNSIQNRHIATILSEPPADLVSNTALQLMPGCAWFQVEFLMPEDPRNALDHPDANTRSENLRWTEVPPGATYIFVPDTMANRALIASNTGPNTRSADFGLVVPGGPDTIANRRIRTWPYAIRVTARIFDPRGRLEDPIVRTVVHRFD